MTLLYRVLPAHVYISLCVAGWGLVASLQSVASSFETMLVLRALLGIAEAAFGPGVPFYLSFFYKREELAFRTGLFISAAPLATSFASSLAWLITKLGEGGPIAAWRLLFLVEGFPSIVVAIVAWYHIPDSPETASFLTRRGRHVARLRLKTEGRATEISHDHGLKWREIVEALLDPKCYVTAVCLSYGIRRGLSANTIGPVDVLQLQCCLLKSTTFLTNDHQRVCQVSTDYERRLIVGRMNYSPLMSQV